MGRSITVQRSFLLAALMITAAVGACAQSSAPQKAVTSSELKFARVYTLLARHYVAPIEPDRAILEGGVRGMLSVLDPFSTFLDRDELRQLQAQTRGEAKGFGSILYVQPGHVLVLESAPGSPAWRAGLGPGDQILSVNGTLLDSLDLPSLIQFLRSARSGPVRLSVLPAGQDVSENVHLNPAEVALPTIDESLLFPTSNVGYIHLTGFEEKTPAEVANAVQGLGGNGLKGLILDLRDNPGGLVEAAVGVASLFLKPGSEVLRMEGRSVPPTIYRTAKNPDHFTIPLIVLVNSHTASAAEVLTAALQDHDRAVIVGEPTFGKGVVESIMPLAQGTAVALITAEYFTPSGRSIQRPLPGTELETSLRLLAHAKFHTADGRPVVPGGGVTPDVEVPGRNLDRWELFLDETGAFTRFAENYLNLHGKVAKSFRATDETLGEFKDYLHQHGIATPTGFWVSDASYLKLRIDIEMLSLGYGLNAGNHLETRHDPQVLRALAVIPETARILAPPSH